MTAATKDTVHSLLATYEEDLPKPPKNETGARFVAHAWQAYGMTAPADDLHEALELGWTGYKLGESLAVIWDYRGDTADYDPAATPVIIAVVGVIYSDGE